MVFLVVDWLLQFNTGMDRGKTVYT